MNLWQIPVPAGNANRVAFSKRAQHTVDPDIGLAHEARTRTPARYASAAGFSMVDVAYGNKSFSISAVKLA